MTAIKERPILFSAPMVRAILDGRKTVTRRPVKVQPRSRADIGSYGKGQPFIRNPDVTKRNPECPFGKPGDRLWVRETWYCDHNEVMRGPYLKPDDLDVSEARDDGTLVYAADGLTPYEADQPVWKPSIHMPRWACRILLEITDVRVERLQDISDEQAKAEGCFFTDYGQVCFHGGRGVRDAAECEYPASKHQQRPGWMWDKTNSHEQCLDTARHAFGNLWNSTGGDWDANPWVWVFEFKQVQP